MNSLRLSLSFVVVIGIFLALGPHQAPAQASVDLSFNASLTKVPEGDARGVFPQPDGKIFVVGAFKAVNGKSRPSIVKLNNDGSVDTSFYGPDIRATEPTYPARILDLGIQSTGKILIAGEFYEVDGQPKYRLVRLNADGSLDTTFAAQPLSWVVTDIIVLPDDKMLIGGGFQYLDPSGTRNRLVRLNADGTLDTSLTFSPEPDATVSRILRQPDGKLVVAYGNKVARYTTTGSLDPTFGPIDLNQPAAALAEQADGRILVGGYFNSVNGFPMTGIFRATIDGAIDTSFASMAPNDDVISIDVAPDQRILVGGAFSIYGATTRKRSAILDANGNLLNTYVPSSNPLIIVYATAFQADGKVLIGGQGDSFSSVPVPLLVRTNPDGSIDSGFNPKFGLPGIGARLLVQPDGKILATGQFRAANEDPRRSITRFNADGSVDAGFVPSDFVVASLDALLTGLDLQSDGKILVVGTTPGNIKTTLRLQSNGAYDRDLSSDPAPRDVKFLSNGQILVGAGFKLRRLNSDGLIDGTFNPAITGYIYRIVLQPDGKILIGGDFTQVNGSTRNGIARLNFDGTLDATFNPPGGANGLVSDIALQADGKIIIAGEFTGVNFDTNRKYLARLNANGLLDSGYVPLINASAYALKLQPDGRLLIGGDFTLVNGVQRGRFARLNPNGSLETSFNVTTNDTILDIELQNDGKIVYAGEFTRTNGVSTVGIGRLLNPPVTGRTPFDFDRDGRADVSIFRPSTNRWYETLGNGQVAEEAFGSAGDILAPADFDGDGATDEGIFRPSNGQWWYKSSINGAQLVNPFGQTGDIPRPSDFDGDGKADFVLFRPSINSWIRFGSQVGNVPDVQFGLSGDQPLVGDFDGDGRSDLAIFRPSNGDWWYAASSAGGAFRNVHWGQNGDIPVPADYDADGKTDYAIFRPSDGGWYIYNSGNGSFTTTAFGTSGDRPVAADYDGDGRADIAVFRPSTGIWYLLRSTAGFAGYQFGISTDAAVPGSLIP